jgi:hypothetical protein
MSEETQLEKFNADKQNSLSLKAYATQISKEIKTEAQFSLVAETLVKIKTARKLWEEKIGPIVKTAHLAHKKIKDFQNEIDLPLREAEENILKPALAQWRNAQEEARRALEKEMETETGIPTELPKEGKAKGISYGTNYSAQVLSLREVCRGVVEGFIPESYILPNMVALNGAARSMKEGFDHAYGKFGLKMKKETIVGARAEVVNA